MQRAAEEANSLFPEDKHHLRLGFCIPGILYPEKSPSQLDHAALTKTFAVNTIGPLLMMKHFTPFLPKKSTDIESQTPHSKNIPPHAVWTTMSARVGSTNDNSLGGWYSYRASKAGVSSISKTLDLHLRNRSGENAMAIAYHPGTVKTGLSKEFWESVQLSMLFEPELAAEKMMLAVNGIGLEGRGRCWDWKGTEVLP
jgi:NAD(P)-dependent dehydrogenase (short-subunit alcohol dehydrogenase family)